MPARNGSWNGSKWIRKDKRLAIYMRDNWRCVYCQKDLSKVRPRLRTLDHVVPVTNNGSNEHTNLVTCCKRCNDSKQDRTLDQWIKNAARRKLITQRIFDQPCTPINRVRATQSLAGIIDQQSLPTQEVR
jgi:hypothetical protein